MLAAAILPGIGKNALADERTRSSNIDYHPSAPPEEGDGGA